MDLVEAPGVDLRVVQAKVDAQIPVPLHHGLALLRLGQIGRQLGMLLYGRLQQLVVLAVFLFQKVPQGPEPLHSGDLRALPGESAGVTDGVNGIGHGVEFLDPRRVLGPGVVQGSDGLPKNGLQQIHLGQDLLAELLRVLLAGLNKLLVSQRHKKASFLMTIVSMMGSEVNITHPTYKTITEIQVLCILILLSDKNI